jgi:hypothetical protein
MSQTVEELDAQAKKELADERERHAAVVATIGALDSCAAADELDGHVRRVGDIMVAFQGRCRGATPSGVGPNPITPPSTAQEIANGARGSGPGGGAAGSARRRRGERMKSS